MYMAFVRTQLIIDTYIDKLVARDRKPYMGHFIEKPVVLYDLIIFSAFEKNFVKCVPFLQYALEVLVNTGYAIYRVSFSHDTNVFINFK